MSKEDQHPIYRYVKKYVLILKDCKPVKPVFFRFGLVLVFYFISLESMSAANVLAAMRYPRHAETLPDLGFSIFPAMNWKGLSNFFLLCSALSALRFIFHRKGLTIIRRFMTIHGVCCLLRIIVMPATSYPDPSFECVGYTPPDRNHFVKSAMANDVAYTCGDLMPSGHTLFFILMAIQWHRHTHLVERIIMWIFSIVGCISLIVTRLHYTSDVLVGVYIAITVSYIYHIYAEDINYRSRIFIMSWLEADFNPENDKESTKLSHPHHQLVDVQDDSVC